MKCQISLPAIAQLAFINLSIGIYSEFVLCDLGFVLQKIAKVEKFYCTGLLRFQPNPTDYFQCNSGIVILRSHAMLSA